MASLGDQKLKDQNPAAGIKSSNQQAPQDPGAVATISNTNPLRPNTEPPTMDENTIDQQEPVSRQPDPAVASPTQKNMTTTNQNNMQNNDPQPVTTTPMQTNNTKQSDTQQQSPQGQEYAGILRRYAAASIDSMIVTLVTSIFTVPLTLMGTTSSGDGASSIINLAVWLFQIIIYIVYYVYFIGSKAQTPGKMLLKVKVLKEEDSSMPTFVTAFLREIVGKFVSAVILGLGYIWALFDDKKQSWHDKIAGTVVVKDGELSTGRKLLVTIIILLPFLLVIGMLIVFFALGVAVQDELLMNEDFMMEQQEQQLQELQREMENFEDTGSTAPEYNFNEN